MQNAAFRLFPNDELPASFAKVRRGDHLQSAWKRPSLYMSGRTFANDPCRLQRHIAQPSFSKRAGGHYCMHVVGAVRLEFRLDNMISRRILERSDLYSSL